MNIQKGVLSNIVLLNTTVYPKRRLVGDDFPPLFHHGCHTYCSLKSNRRPRPPSDLGRDEETENLLFSSCPAQRKAFEENINNAFHSALRQFKGRRPKRKPVRTDLISSNLSLYERVFAFHPTSLAWILSHRGWQCAEGMMRGQSGREKRFLILR